MKHYSKTILSIPHSNKRYAPIVHLFKKFTRQILLLCVIAFYLFVSNEEYHEQRDNQEFRATE